MNVTTSESSVKTSVLTEFHSEEERFNALYEQYHEHLHRHILYTVRKNPEMAKEVEQLTWIKVWRYLRPNRPTGYTWLCMIARSVTVDLWRHEATIRKHEEVSLDIPLPGGDTFEENYLPGQEGKSTEEFIIEQENALEDQRLCRALLARLTQIQREALLAQSQGETARDQAACTGKTVQAVCMARRHGLRNIQRRLKCSSSYTFSRPRKTQSSMV